MSKLRLLVSKCGATQIKIELGIIHVHVLRSGKYVVRWTNLEYSHPFSLRNTYSVKANFFAHKISGNTYDKMEKANDNIHKERYGATL